MIITYKEPLLFVQAPPMYVKVEIARDESTSVFVRNERDDIETINQSHPEISLVEMEKALEQEVEVTAVSEVVQKPIILEKLKYLSEPFAKQAYTPLEFELDQEKITGTIVDLEDDTLLIRLADKDEEVATLDITTIKEVSWRGKPFSF